MQANFTMNSFTMPYFKIYSFRKKSSVMEFLASNHGTQGIAQTVLWPCQPIILSIEYFKGPTEVKLNSC